MDTSFIYELIGYLASALVAVSLMMSKIVRLSRKAIASYSN